MPNELRNFLALSYDELEDLNIKAKEQRRNRVASHKVQEISKQFWRGESSEGHARHTVVS